MSVRDELRGAPAAIGVVVLALLFFGVIFAIYPSWQEVWGLIKNKNDELMISLIIPAIASIAAALSAYFSWKTLYNHKKIKKDDELLAHAIFTLERAYASFMKNSENGMPVANRLNWLTAARLLLNYADTKKQLRMMEVIRRCEGHEEFWRNEFHGTLSRVSSDQGFFSRNIQVGSEVEKRSAVIIHGFASWPKEKIDEIDRFPTLDDAIQDFGLHMWWISLRIYLDRM